MVNDEAGFGGQREGCEEGRRRDTEEAGKQDGQCIHEVNEPWAVHWLMEMG